MRFPASFVYAIAAGAVLVACSDMSGPAKPSAQRAPTAEPSLSVAGVPNFAALLRSQPLGPKVGASATINGAAGGRIDLPSAGFSVVVPAGAFAGTLTISISALPGRAVGYEFEPHGIVFNRPLVATQNLAGLADVHGLQNFSALRGGYFASQADVNPATGNSHVTETVGASVSGGVAVFLIPHFSGWQVGSGRSADE
jgi:hypothetical protein